jgi:hypothetical protein
MDYTTSFTIKSNTGVGLPFNLFTPDIETNSEAEFAANDTRKDKVKEVKLTELVLTVVDPENETFSFVKDVYLFINADGLDEKRFAYKENIDNSSQRLELILEDLDLAEYIKKDEFKLRARTVTDEALTRDVKVQTYMKFRVKAKPI